MLPAPAEGVAEGRRAQESRRVNNLGREGESSLKHGGGKGVIASIKLRGCCMRKKVDLKKKAEGSGAGGRELGKCGSTRQEMAAGTVG